MSSLRIRGEIIFKKKSARKHSSRANSRKKRHRPLKLFTWFLVQKKSENPYFTNQKLLQKIALLQCLEKWGKKLAKTVRNFWDTKYESSASFCTKNYLKIFKTRWNRSVSFQCKNCFFFGNKKTNPEKAATTLFKSHLLLFIK